MIPRPSNLERRRCAANRMRMGIVFVTCLALLGCSAMRRQVVQRREACDALCKQAKAARSEGAPDRADLLLNEAVRQRPDDLETRRHLAEAMWDCGRQQDAISEYRELTETHPRDPRLPKRLAEMLWSEGQKEQAAKMAEQALRLNPTCTEALLVKARTEAARRELDASVATYIRLTRAAPDLIDAKLELAEVHVERGFSNQACTILRDVLGNQNLTEGQRADVEWKLGLAYAAADRWAEAASHLGNSIARRESTGGDWQMLVVAKSLAGQDTDDIESRAVLASGRHSTEVDSSAWIGLRDRLVVRGTLIGNGTGAQGSIIRADFSRSAQADPPATRQ